MIKRLKEILPQIVRSDTENILFIVGIAIYWSLHWINFIGVPFVTSTDTSTYFAAGEWFARGEIDYLRTPVYPLLCHYLHSYFGENVLEAIVGVQLVIFYISIIFFHRTISLFTQNWAYKFIPTALYAWSIPMFEMCMYIMTESISVSATVVLLYCLSRMIVGKAGRGTIWSAAATLLFLILLRPFNICFVPILIIILYISYRRGSFKHKLSAITSLSIVGVTLFGYCLWFKITFGFFGFSYVSSLNIYLISFDDGMTRMPYNELTLKQKIGHATDYFWVWYDRDNCKEETQQLVRDNLSHFVKGKIALIGKSCFRLYPHAKTSVAYDYAVIFQCVCMNIVFIALAFLIVFELWLWFKKKRRLVPIMAFHLLICFISIAITIIGSSNCEVARLTMPMFPSLCLMVGIFADQIGFSFKKDIEDQSDF